MHAHLTIQLASKIGLKLLVVNSVKLHLTALIYYVTINFIYLCFNAFKVKGTILKVLENLVRTGVEKRYFLSSCEDFEEDMCTVVPGKILHNFLSFFYFSKSLHSTPNNTQFIFERAVCCTDKPQLIATSLQMFNVVNKSLRMG